MSTIYTWSSGLACVEVKGHSVSSMMQCCGGGGGGKKSMATHFPQPWVV